MTYSFNTMEIEAEYIVQKLNKNGFPSADTWRQVMCVVEEAGEFLSAWRRFSGNAHRSGTHAEMAEELADVLITVFVAAQILDVDLTAEVIQKMARIHTRGWKEQ